MKNQPKQFKKHVDIVRPMENPKKGHLKRNLYIVLGLFAIIWTLIGVYGVVDFVNNHDFRTPIIFQNPITSKYKNVLISPVASGSAKTSFIDVGQIANKIYTLESSGGKNDSCRNMGLYNGYGFRQNSSEHICYTSHEEVRSLVIEWLTINIGKYGLEKALCRYNEGINETGCTYSANYLTLK